ncbi:hypothetical protein ACEP2X_08260, partial [Pseudomonas aeruginosa]
FEILLPQAKWLGRVIYCANPRQISRRATADNAHGVIRPTHPGNAGQRPNSVGRITARGYPPLIRDIGG